MSATVKNAAGVTQGGLAEDLAALPPLLTARDVCSLIGCTRQTLERRVARGVFPKPLRVSGSSVRWSKAAVLTYLQELERSAG